MVTATLVYWAAIGCLVYTLLVYPGVLAYWNRRAGRSAHMRGWGGPEVSSISVVMLTHHEPDNLGRRVPEFVRRIAELGLDGEILVVADGHDEASARVVREFSSPLVPVRLVSVDLDAGRGAMVAAGCKAARHDVVVMADTRHVWTGDALRRLLLDFTDSSVGAVGGVLTWENGSTSFGKCLRDPNPPRDRFHWGWGDDAWLTRQEEPLRLAVQLEGAICAARREAINAALSTGSSDPIRWPLRMVIHGFRLGSAELALAADERIDSLGELVGRRVRQLANRFSLLVALPEALEHWRNPAWMSLVSHMLLRLVVPWAWIVAYIGSIGNEGTLNTVIAAAQTSIMVVGLVGLIPAFAQGSAIAWSASAFLLESAAAWLAFWVWLGDVVPRLALQLVDRLRIRRSASLENLEVVRSEPAK